MILIEDVRSGSDIPVFISNVELLNDDLTSTPATTSNISIFVSVSSKTGALLATNIPALPVPESPIVPPSSFVAHVPSLPSNTSPWKFTIAYHDQNGLAIPALFTESVYITDANT